VQSGKLLQPKNIPQPTDNTQQPSVVAGKKSPAARGQNTNINTVIKTRVK